MTIRELMVHLLQFDLETPVVTSYEYDGETFYVEPAPSDVLCWINNEKLESVPGDGAFQAIIIS